MFDGSLAGLNIRNRDCSKNSELDPTEKNVMHFCGLCFLANLDKKTFQFTFSIFEFCLCKFEVDFNFDLYQVKNAIHELFHFISH